MTGFFCAAPLPLRLVVVFSLIARKIADASTPVICFGKPASCTKSRAVLRPTNDGVRDDDKEEAVLDPCRLKCKFSSRTVIDFSFVMCRSSVSWVFRRTCFSTCFCYGKKVLTVIEMHTNLYMKKVQ